MHGKVSTEYEVFAPADDVWAEFILSPEGAMLILKLLPNVFEKIDVMTGNGGVGTVLHVVTASGAPLPRSWTEKIVTIDNEKRLRVIRTIEGGYLELGFNLFEGMFEIIEKDANSCIIKASIIFGADDDKFEAIATHITPYVTWVFGKAIGDYIAKENEKANACNK